VISLSMPLTAIHPDDDVRETVLHEIARALVGPGHGHDEAWRAQAVAIGSKGERCLADDVPTLPGRFTGTCPQGHQVARHKRPTRVTSCSTCSHSFDHRSLLTWAIGDVSIRMLPTYVADLVRIVDSTGSSIARSSWTSMPPSVAVAAIAPLPPRGSGLLQGPVCACGLKLGNTPGRKA
jgi:hypothetical protein